MNKENNILDPVFQRPELKITDDVGSNSALTEENRQLKDQLSPHITTLFSQRVQSKIKDIKFRITKLSLRITTLFIQRVQSKIQDIKFKITKQHPELVTEETHRYLSLVNACESVHRNTVIKETFSLKRLFARRKNGSNDGSEDSNS